MKRSGFSLCLSLALITNAAYLGSSFIQKFEPMDYGGFMDLA